MKQKTVKSALSGVTLQIGNAQVRNGKYFTRAEAKQLDALTNNKDLSKRLTPLQAFNQLKNPPQAPGVVTPAPAAPVVSH